MSEFENTNADVETPAVQVEEEKPETITVDDAVAAEDQPTR